MKGSGVRVPASASGKALARVVGVNSRCRSRGSKSLHGPLPPRSARPRIGRLITCTRPPAALSALTARLESVRYAGALVILGALTAALGLIRYWTDAKS